MAKLHIAQIAYLSQDLTEQIKTARHHIVRTKLELDLIQQTLGSLLAVCDDLVSEKDFD